MADQADIVIVGGGPAGIAAACAAGEAGKGRVVLLDNMPALGGNIWRAGAAHKGSAKGWIDRLSRTKVEVVHGATVFGGSTQKRIIEVEVDDGTGKMSVKEIAFRNLILAVGARELFLPFPGWTLPNVFGCGGLQALAKGGWPVEGKRVVVAGTGPLLLAAAGQLVEEGAHVLAVLEQAPMGRLMNFGMKLPLLSPSKIAQAIGYKWKLRGIPFKTGCWIKEARGNGKIESVTASDGHKTWDCACDYLACGFSLIPSLEIPVLLGCEITDGTVKVNDAQETSQPGIYCAGEPNGIGGVETSLVEGEIAGYAAVGANDRAASLAGTARRGRKFRAALAKAFELREELKHLARPDTLICRCEDVTRERMESYAGPAGGWRAAKLQTRCGMGPCQGRICGGAARVLFGWENTIAGGSSGGTGVRVPAMPVCVDSLAAVGGEKPSPS